MENIPLTHQGVNDRPLVLVESITIPLPAAGLEFSYTVPLLTRLILQSLSFIFTTDANVASRNVAVFLTSPAGLIFLTGHNTSIPAGIAEQFCIAPGLTITEGGGLNLRKTLPWPALLSLNEGTTISSSTSGIQAGDQFSAIIMQVLIQHLTE